MAYILDGRVLELVALTWHMENIIIKGNNLKSKKESDSWRHHLSSGMQLCLNLSYSSFSQQIFIDCPLCAERYIKGTTTTKRGYLHGIYILVRENRQQTNGYYVKYIVCQIMLGTRDKNKPENGLPRGGNCHCKCKRSKESVTELLAWILEVN